MEFFNNITSLDDLKSEYRKLCMKFHPDLGGDEETMKRLNAEYEHILKNGFVSEKVDFETEAVFREVLEKLIVLQGITIEICGNWLWVYGETYKHKEALKAFGLKFASKKKCWFWKPDDYKGTRHREFTLEEIRERHGSRTVRNFFGNNLLTA